MTSSEKNPFPVWYTLKFTGSAAEYFRIWIVNLLLTVITLGIYSAWAKVRTLAYFYGHTTINDSGFSFLADPVKILRGRIVAVGLFAIYWGTQEFYPEHILWAVSALVLLFPLILVTALSFRMRNTAFRNIRFHFNPDYAGAYGMFIIPVLVILALTWVGYSSLQASDFVKHLQEQSKGQFRVQDMVVSVLVLSAAVFVPYFLYLKSRFMVEHTSYGSCKASFHARGWDFYKYFLFALVTFIVLVIATSVLVGVVAAWAGIAGHKGAAAASPAPALIGILTVLVIYGAGFFIVGYLNARITNLIFTNIQLGENRLQSHLRPLTMGWLYLSNTIAIILSVTLLIPWAQVRMARYRASCTEILEKDFHSIEAVAQPERSAIGEEIGDLFNFDIGF